MDRACLFRCVVIAGWLLFPAVGQAQPIVFNQAFWYTFSKPGSSTDPAYVQQFRIVAKHVKRGDPITKDIARDYAHWGRNPLNLDQFVIWRTVNGKAILGINLARSYESNDCGKPVCKPKIQFLGFNSTGYVQAPADTKLVQKVCRASFDDLLKMPELDAVLKNQISGKAKAYAQMLAQSEKFRTRCLFPRYGTSIKVIVNPDDVAFAFQDQALPLMYFRFNNVKGMFLPSRGR